MDRLLVAPLRRPGPDLRRLVLALVLTGCSAQPAPEAVPPEPLTGWPPQVGRPFPDLTFHDADGEPFRLSSLRGKVVLVEPIGMSCPACNAFAGANRPGGSGYAGTRPQANLLSVDEMLAAYAGGVTLDHPDLVLVHLLLYDMKLGAPGPEDARRWAEHFGIRGPGHLVVHADRRFVNSDSYGMIPGFQLIDREGIVRSDSTGHHPRDDLYRTLLPMLEQLVRNLP